jgi:hypothetical protein
MLKLYFAPIFEHKATSHMRLRARDQVHFRHSHWWKRQTRVEVRFTILLRDQLSM